jgi:sigma-B regulation protein RsbU (phosphoserine phosphatase)
MAHLTTISGPDPGKMYTLAKAKTVLGRHPDCDVVIDVGAVSRYHAQIVQEGADFFVEDLKSRNGTYVNEQIISGRHRLVPGDTVRVCEVSYKFHTAHAVFPASPEATIGGSGSAPVLWEEERPIPSSTIMSKLDVSSSQGRVHMSVSAEAKLAALLQITQSLGKALGLDEVLPQVLESLFRIFLQADRGFIVLRSADGNLVPRWIKLRRDDGQTLIRISRTIVNQVMESKTAILSADAASDTRFEMSQSIADFRIRSMMCAPLVDADGTAIGALQVDTVDQRNRFREEDLELLVSVASQAAIAIDNAQLHENALRQRSFERDLELAHQVQRGFLPMGPPKLPGFEFYDYYRAANQVGGDYYGYLELPDGRVAVLVADVVGHGIAAALLMSKLSSEARFCLAGESKPAAAITRLNAIFSRDLVEDRFVTMAMAVINPAANELTIVSAGHMAPLIRRGDGQVEEAGAAQAGLPLGIVEDMEYDQFVTPLEAGEHVAMYTDGINEAMNAAGEQYSIQRLKAQFALAVDGPAAVGRRIIEDVRTFVGGHPQTDDICLVLFAPARAKTRTKARGDEDAGKTAIRKG